MSAIRKALLKNGYINWKGSTIITWERKPGLPQPAEHASVFGYTRCSIAHLVQLHWARAALQLHQRRHKQYVRRKPQNCKLSFEVIKLHAKGLSKTSWFQLYQCKWVFSSHNEVVMSYWLRHFSFYSSTGVSQKSSCKQCSFYKARC